KPRGGTMPDLREALSEIRSIRGHMARYTEFRGYGPITLAGTGVLAIVIASMQKLWLVDLEHEPTRFLAMWIGAAAVSLTFMASRPWRAPAASTRSWRSRWCTR